MLASALVPAFAIAVLAPAGPDDGCPSPRQVTDALEQHLPGIVAPLGQPPAPTALRLTVVSDPAGAARLDLTDPGGEPLLRRTLPVATRTERGVDCPALADTVALIVERYWREIGAEVRPVRPTAPRPPDEAAPRPGDAGPPKQAAATGAARDGDRDASRLEGATALPLADAVPDGPGAGGGPSAVTGRAAAPLARPDRGPRFQLGAAIAGRAGINADFDAAAALALAFETASARYPLGFRLSAGVANSAAVDLPYGQATFRRLPLRLGMYVPIGLRLGRLEPGIGLVWDALAVRVTEVPGAAVRPHAASLCSESLCASPGADLAVGWSVVLGPHVYFRALARWAVVVPYRFATAGNVTVRSTSRTYLEAGLEWGFWF